MALIPDLSPIDTRAAPMSVEDLVASQNEMLILPDVQAIAAPAAEKTPVVAEIATIRRNIFIPPVYNWVLEPQDPTLRTRGGGWDYTIYAQAEEDPKVYSTLQKRKMSLGAYPVQFDAASESPLDIAAKELMERAHSAINFPMLVKDLLDAINKGFSVAELMWELVDGPTAKEWLATLHYKRDQRRFRFDDQLRLRLIDWRNMVTGEILPDRKFVVYTFDPHDGDPYGRGLGVMLWWRANFKRQNLVQWMTHNNKFATPTPEGTYSPEAGQDEKNALMNALISFMNGAAVTHPEGTEINLLETSRPAGADTFKVFSDAQDRDIDAIVLGSTYAAKAGNLDGGSGADADQEDRLELAQADGNDLAALLNRTWVKWTVEFNLPGARPPKMRWLIEAEEDLGARAERDSNIESMGFEPSEDYINETYGGEWTKKAQLAPVIQEEATFAQRMLDRLLVSFTQGAAPAPESGPVPKAGILQKLARIATGRRVPNAPTDAIAGKLSDQLAGLADHVPDQWVSEFRRIIADSATLEEARDRLITLYSFMDADHFAQTMAGAITVADLAGRVDTHPGQ